MRIVKRQEFLSMPINTVYSLYERTNFTNLSIKGRTISHEAKMIDFFYMSIIDAIDHTGSTDFMDKLFEAEENGTDLKMDFDTESRDGGFEEDQLFAIWSAEDIRKLIVRLHECLYNL